MLLYLSDEVRECSLHAKTCARNADAQSDPHVRQSFLDAEQSWLALAKRLAHFAETQNLNSDFQNRPSTSTCRLIAVKYIN
jgi:hypothetical protein